MRLLLIFFIWGISNFHLYAQGPSRKTVLPGAGFKIIKILQQVKGQVNGNFYIESISDDRAYKNNIGVVHRRLDRPAIVAMILQDGFLTDLKEATDRWRSLQKNSQKVKMKILEIYLWDYIGAKKEKRFAKVKVEFFNDLGESLGTVQSLVVEPGKYKRFSHEKRLEKAFFECLGKFSKRLKSIKKSNARLANQPKEKKPLKYGKANNFFALKHKEISRVRRLNLIKVGNPSLYRYKPTDKEWRKLDCYAYLDGEDLYVKASNYHHSGDYFAKVLEKGRYLFLIDKIDIASISKDHFQGEIKTNNNPVGIVIDNESGIPYYVTDKFLERLLEPYPDLAGKYMIINVIDNPIQLDRVRRLIGEINQRLEQVDPVADN